MARVTIDTSTKAVSTAFSQQRSIWKTDAGKLILFANVNNILKYKTSTDNGDNWSSWVTVFTSSNTIYSFDTFMDANNNVYLVMWDFDNSTHRLKFIKLTYSVGSWSIGSTINVTSSNSGHPVITQRSNGDLWVGRCYSFSTFSNIYCNISTNDGTSWNTTANFAYTNSQVVSLIPKDSYIWAIVQGNSKLRIYQYDSSWDAGTNIAASGITDSPESLGVLKVSNSKIYVATRTSSGVKLYEYAESWDAGITLSNNANDQSPEIIFVANKPSIIWTDYDGSNYNIAYRKFNGSTWDSQVLLTDDADVDKYPNCVPIDTDLLYVIYTAGSASPYTIYFDKVNLNPTIQKSITSNVHFKTINNQIPLTSNIKFILDRVKKSISSNIVFKGTYQKNINSNINFKTINNQKNIKSSIKFVYREKKTILSNVFFSHTRRKKINSDVYFVTPNFVDITNKIRFTKRGLLDVICDFRFVKRILNDINNSISFVKRIILDVNNDYRAKKGMEYNIKNDVRFIYSWQRAADNTFQSLGKSYIRVFIGGIEQTDVDVDSISISKDLSSSNTAIFDLGRPYDSSKPAIESVVQIKYNNFILYKGYITQITPTANPEKIRINCQDKYWKDNQINKYYHVGHKPQDNTELYYAKIKTALSTQHNWNLDIGDFVPETITNFSKGSSDSITSLIQESGNYEWFFDVDDTKHLWVAGQGNVINIERQELGKNLKLYDLIEHYFTDDVSNLVNKLRVQMGNKVIRKFNTTGGSKSYAGYNYSSYIGYATPAWDSRYERLSKNTDDYGFDRHKPEDDYLYKDVFKRFNLPYLDSSLESWTDWKSPQVWIYGSNLYNREEGLQDAGYTIDYEKKQIIFNEPVYQYNQNDKGEWLSLRTPTIKVLLWKRKYWSFTENPEENPEEDVSNPLMFFTAKMGDYPTTIIKDLNLSNLTIQEGYTYVDSEGVTQVIPSWDDTNFAKDFANWELSKTCDKKINGRITLTLDAIVQYGIRLDKRIFISGITETPMNIISMDYNMSNFTVGITMENRRYYKRTVSLPSHGE